MKKIDIADFDQLESQTSELIKILFKGIYIKPTSEKEIRLRMANKMLFKGPIKITNLLENDTSQLDNLDTNTIKKMINSAFGKILEISKTHLKNEKFIKLNEYYLGLSNLLNEASISEKDNKKLLNIFLILMSELVDLSNYTKIAINSDFDF